MQLATVTVPIVTLQEAWMEVVAYRIFCDNSEVTDRSPNGSPNNDKSLNSKEPNYETTKLSIKHGRVLFCSIVTNQKKCAHILPFVRVFDRYREKHGRIKSQSNTCTQKLISP